MAEKKPKKPKKTKPRKMRLKRASRKILSAKTAKTAKHKPTVLINASPRDRNFMVVAGFCPYKPLELIS